MYIGGENVVTVAAPVVTTVGAATVLPTTGSSTVVTVAISVAVGLLTWAVAYSRVSK